MGRPAGKVFGKVNPSDKPQPEESERIFMKNTETSTRASAETSEQRTTPRYEHSPNGEPARDTSFNPFDLESLRLDASYLSQPVAKKLLTVVPIRRPHKQDFIRVHPGEDYRFPAALLEMHGDREIYLVPPPFISELGENQHYPAVLYLYVNRQKVPALWPVKLPAPDGRQNQWHTSAAEAAEMAMTSWIQVVPNMNLGAYQILQAQAQLSDPEWPDLPFNEILKIAFKDRIIDGPDHLVIKRLRGLI
jgi:hypothetical protein